MNPLQQALSRGVGGTPNGQMQNILQMMNAVRRSANPMQAVQNIAMQNPQLRQAMDLVNTQYGGNAQKAFYDLAAKRGIDPNSILNMLR